MDEDDTGWMLIDETGQPRTNKTKKEEEALSALLAWRNAMVAIDAAYPSGVAPYGTPEAEATLAAFARLKTTVEALAEERNNWGEPS